ncbi:borealin-2-like [Bufo gargarizans]|uniref:borealin-2-like n=1 Tax=Bufo gargarizans TaxID=30331 RepID=UPI001CF14586|nr:borealin-2-like [Bufo gargarizans]
MERLGSRAEGSADSGLGMVDPLQEQKNEKIRLFMDDFIQQKRERMKEVKKELEVLSMLPDQILEVELLKMPMSLRQMKVGEYYKLMEFNKTDLAPVVKVDSLDEELREAKLVRKTSRKVKMTTSVEYHEAVGSKAMTTTQENRSVQKDPKSKSLVSLTNDAEKKTSLTRTATAYSARSSRNCGVSSLGDLPLHDGLPLVHIPSVDGQTLSSAYDDLESLHVELLIQDIVQNIHALVGQLTNLYAKAPTQLLAGGHV